MKTQIATAAAAFMLVLAASAGAATSPMGALNASEARFSNTFSRIGDDLGDPLGFFTDIYTFSLSSTATVSGNFGVTLQGGRTTLSAGLALSGGSLAAPLLDLTPGPFSFSDLSAGEYSLAVNGRFGGLAGVSAYEGRISATTVSETPVPGTQVPGTPVSAIPEPSSAALLLAGGVLAWVARRTLRRREPNA